MSSCRPPRLPAVRARRSFSTQVRALRARRERVFRMWRRETERARAGILCARPTRNVRRADRRACKLLVSDVFSCAVRLYDM